MPTEEAAVGSPLVTIDRHQEFDLVLGETAADVDFIESVFSGSIQHGSASRRNEAGPVCRPDVRLMHAGPGSGEVNHLGRIESIHYCTSVN